MWHRDSKLDHANVVAGFESQDDAEEAVLGLRMSGYQDKKIGYYFANGHGEMDDQLARYHRFAGSVIGGLIGALVGWVVARWLLAFGQDLDQFGLALSLAGTGAFFFGMLGGLMGLWLKQPKDEVIIPNCSAVPYVITVDAGDTRDQAWSIIHRHFGHELETTSASPPERNQIDRVGVVI